MSLNPASKTESFLLALFFLLLPTQFGKHFWPDFSLVSGIRIDYLSPILYTTDIILRFLFGAFILRWMQERLDISIQSIPKAKRSLERRSHKRSHEIFKIKMLGRKRAFLIAFLILFIVGNSIFSLRPLVALYGWIKVSELTFIVCYLARTIRLRSQLRFIALLFSISALFESLLAIAQYVNQGSFNGVFYFFGERAFTGDTPGIANASIAGQLILRPYGTFPHPNVLAGFLLVTMVLLWSFVLKSSERKFQLLGGISLLFSSIALLLTFSRIAILLWACLLTVIVGRMVVQRLKTVRSRFFALAIIALSLIVLGIVPLTHEVITRFAQTSLSDESVTERTELLSSAIKMIENRPLSGVGLDNFIPALAPLQKPMPLGLYLQPVHNIFVLVFSGTGFVGFVLFIWLIYRTVQRIRNQQAGVKMPFLISFFIILVTGSFDHYWLTLQQGQLLFATIIGFSWAKIQKF